MKLRLQDNSLRVRLTRGEVRHLASGQRVEQTTEFSPISTLITQIEPSAAVDRSAAVFESQRLIVTVPLEGVRRWAESDQVGIEATQPIAEGRLLHLLIEKDFDCLHSRPEENIDTFPNPKRTGLT
jgi:hypothetical protein